MQNGRKQQEFHGRIRYAFLFVAWHNTQVSAVGIDYLIVCTQHSFTFKLCTYLKQLNTEDILLENT